MATSKPDLEDVRLENGRSRSRSILLGVFSLQLLLHVLLLGFLRLLGFLAAFRGRLFRNQVFLRLASRQMFIRLDQSRVPRRPATLLCRLSLSFGLGRRLRLSRALTLILTPITTLLIIERNDRITRQRARLGHLARLRPELRLRLRGPVEEVRLELRAVLVEADRVAERADGGVGGREGEGLRDEADGAHCVPHAHELDVDVHGEGFLEGGGLGPAELVGAGEHLVGEGDLLVVARREQANLRTDLDIRPKRLLYRIGKAHLVNHSSEGACGIGSS